MTAYSRSFVAAIEDGEIAAVRLADDIRSRAEQNNLKGVLLFAGIGFDIPRFCNMLSKQLPNTPMIGTTSCLGTGSERGFHAAPCVTALAFYGDGFSIGTGFSTKHGRDATSRGRALAAKALAQANMPADKARFAFLFCSMGDEQAMLDGIYEMLPKKLL
jgi:hypothetical protein